MAEMLYTEAQWREIADIENRTGRWSYQLLSNPPSKSVLGPLFLTGEYRVCWFPEYARSEFVGPPEYTFLIYEARSEMVLSAADSLPLALELARESLQVIGAEPMLCAIAFNAVAVDERRAKEEAEQAVWDAKQSSKRERRVKGLSKRAKAVFAASEGKCHYCEAELDIGGKWHIEHKFPRALFGGSEQSNLVAACAPCNHRKRDKTDLEFIAAQAAKAST